MSKIINNFKKIKLKLNFQAANFNFIDSLFSCGDNGGFLAELNSDLRIEAFSSLIMVMIIMITMMMVNDHDDYGDGGD